MSRQPAASFLNTNAKFIFCLFFLLLVPQPSFSMTKCCIAIGKLICKSDPKMVENVEVNLIDWDGGTFLDQDDAMGITYSNEDGTFQVEGCGYDFGPWNEPDPYLKIWHHCNAPKGKEIQTKIQRIFRPETNNFGDINLD